MGSPSRAVLHALLAATLDLGFHVSAVHARHLFFAFPAVSVPFNGASWIFPSLLVASGERQPPVCSSRSTSSRYVTHSPLSASSDSGTLEGGVSFCLPNPKLQSKGPSSPHTSWALKPWSRFPALPEKKKSFLLFLSLFSVKKNFKGHYSHLSSCDIIASPTIFLSPFLSLRTSGAVYPISLSYIFLPLYLYFLHSLHHAFDHP